MMQKAERENLEALELYGSRKKHHAIDLALNKTLMNYILRQLRCLGAICSNDTQSCYDLIGHTQASLAMQHQGVSKAVVDMVDLYKMIGIFGNANSGNLY
jgi:hypothetical protein